jgi:amidase
MQAERVRGPSHARLPCLTRPAIASPGSAGTGCETRHPSESARHDPLRSQRRRRPRRHRPPPALAGRTAWRVACTRIEAVDPAVNCMVARDIEGARAVPREQERSCRRPRRCSRRRCFGLPLGVKDLENTGRPAHHLWQRRSSPRTSCRRRTRLIVRHAAPRRGHRAGKTNTPEWGAGANTRNAVYGATGNPFDPALSAAGSSGGSARRAGLRHGAARHRLGHGRVAAQPGRLQRHRRLPSLAGADRQRQASTLWLQPPERPGPMARTVPDLCLLLSTMSGADDGCDPLAVVFHGGGSACPEPSTPCRRRSTSSKLRVAVTRGLRLQPQPSRPSVQVLRSETVGLLAPISSLNRRRPDARLYRDRPRFSRCCAPSSSWPAPYERVRDTPDTGRAERARQCRGGAWPIPPWTSTDALKQQTALYRAWQRFFHDFDVIMSPSITLSPRPWSRALPRRDRRQAHARPTSTGSRNRLCRDQCRLPRHLAAARARPCRPALRAPDRRPARR